MARCGKCGEENPARARFCLACAASLAAFSGGETRRTVTVLFADMVGSTGLAGSLDPEAWRSVQRRYFDALRGVIERHGGTVEKYVGDAVMAVFGWPALHEDDALRAARAATELAPALFRLNDDLEGRRASRIQLRIGVATGEVLATEAGALDETLVTGEAVTRAARLQQAAAPGEVLVDVETVHLVRDAVETEPPGTVAAKGIDGGITAHRLLRVTGEAAHRRRFETPLVGRAAELSALAAGLDRAAQARDVELVTIVAPAGVGKSRLVREFLARASTGATVLRGRCLNYGDGITYWALAEIVREAAGVDEGDGASTARSKVGRLVAADDHAGRVAATLESVLGVTASSASGDEISWALRRLLALLATARPVVVLVEDLHWAAADLLDLVEAVVDWGVGVPVLFVGTARPDLLETRPAFGAGRPNATMLPLEPLGPADAGALIDLLPGGSALPPLLRSRIGAAAEGNPLFVEEMLGMLVDLGHLTDATGEWTVGADLADVAVPSSVRALLAARIDALERGERAVAERAAVIGRSFERSAVAELTATAERARLGARLLSLARKQLIRRDAPGLDGDDTFRFRHVLIRDAAYEALPKAVRAELHERFAAWLERAAGDRRLEYVEILAHHLATAFEYRVELGTLGERPALPGAAVAVLLDAGGRAESIHAYREAARLLQRAVALIDALPVRTPPADPGELLERAAEAAWRGGDYDLAVALGDDALSRAAGSADPARLARLHANAAAYAREVGAEEQEAWQVGEARRLLAGAADPRDRAVILARLARMLMLARRDAESEGLCREVVDAADAGAETLASVHITLGTVLLRLHRLEEAARAFDRGRGLAEEAGTAHELARWYVNSSMLVAETAGPMAAAERLREGVQAMAARGYGATAAARSIALNLGVHDLDNGRAAEFEVMARELLQSGVSGNHALWLTVGLVDAGTKRGNLEAARRAADAGRRLARRWGGAEHVSDLAFRESEVYLWLGSPERAIDLAAESRTLANPDDVAAILRSDAHALWGLADLADWARAVGDAGAAAALGERAGRVRAGAQAALRGEAGSGRQEAALAAWIEAELSRCMADPDPLLWAEVVGRCAAAGWRSTTAYAAWRQAQALEAIDARPTEIRAAVQAALADADANEPVRRELVAMAERLGTDTPPVDAAGEWSPPGV